MVKIVFILLALVSSSAFAKTIRVEGIVTRVHEKGLGSITSGGTRLESDTIVTIKTTYTSDQLPDTDKTTDNEVTIRMKRSHHCNEIAKMALSSNLKFDIQADFEKYNEALDNEMASCSISKP